MNNHFIIDVAVLCHEYTQLEKMCDDHVIDLDNIQISEHLFKQIFYPYGENFGIDKNFINSEEMIPYVSFISEYRKINGKPFHLLEEIFKNLEHDLGVSRNCFTVESRVELTNEIMKLKGLNNMNCCSVLASLPWSNITEILDKQRLPEQCNHNFTPIFVVSIVFKTPTTGVKNTVVRLQYKIT